MDLSRSLLKDFAKIVEGSSSDKETTKYVRGTVTSNDNGKYVKLDGSTTLTPISEVVDVQDGDRVLVSIENHKATVLGNFTFVPSARKEQEALDKAEGAQNAADAAQDTADSAVGTAQSASAKADQAISKANEASGLADEAKESATEAINAANTAKENAQAAQTAADEAKTSASTARQEAAAAQTAASNAQSEVANINQEIVSVKSDLSGALSDIADQAAEIEATKETMELNYAKKTDVSEVEATLTTEISKKVGELQITVEETYAAKTDVVDLEGRLQTQITQNESNISSTATKVEKLESDTAAAQEQVNIAVENASAAQTAASNAQAKAEEAQIAADEARENADLADKKAQDANDVALDAKLAAHVADQALADARTDLEEARKNYELVANDPNSTPAEIEAAQVLVDTATEAVNAALEDATEAAYAASQAQAAADKAQEDAASAQSAAAQAQTKADNAQVVADKAQENALKAQEDVAALTKRVTTAETNINQNAEQIALTAQKTDEIGDSLVNNYYNKIQADAAIQLAADTISAEVSAVNEKLANDYYTKEQTDAAIQLTSESITSTVSKTYTTKSDAIKSTVEQFYQSNSPTTLSGGSWSTTQPTWTEGKYIWRRTLVTKADGSTSYNPDETGVCITGNTGASGEDGKGITKTEVFYYLSTSNTTQSGGSWDTTVPAWVDGKYYWQKFKYTYTDNTTSESAPVCVTGGKGSDGQNGTGIESMTTEFYLSDSKETQTGGSWVTEMPTWSSGKYLWTRQKIVYKDPPSTEYTTPVCDSSWEAVNEVKVDIEQAQSTADEAASSAAESEEQISIISSEIQQLADQISLIITDEDGNSMMTQTSEGWRFDISTITNTLDNAMEAIANTEGDVDDLSQLTSNLESLVNDLSEKTAYIIMATDDEGNPCIELGKEGNPFKVRITNTSVDFMEGSSKIAYVSNRALFIETAIVKNELKIGEGSGFIWKTRSNGNMGVRWVEGGE